MKHVTGPSVIGPTDLQPGDIIRKYSRHIMSGPDSVSASFLVKGPVLIVAKTGWTSYLCANNANELRSLNLIDHVFIVMRLT